MSIIPYGRQYIDQDDINNVVEALKSDYLTTGPKVKEFEDELAKITGAKYAVAVSNGTTALHLASMCLLKENDKVLTTPNSFLSTSNSILYVKAKPIFVDIQEDGNIDLELCEKYLKDDPSIKAIYAVHFSGKPVEQNKLKYLKEKYNIKILEDCSHSLGAYQIVDSEIINAGSCRYSDCSTLSFHPVKQITTGEGGAITTNNEEIYKHLLKLRSHGMTRESSDFENKEMAFTDNKVNSWYYEMHELGHNYRLTDIQAALGLSQLNKLNIFIQKRKELSKLYESYLPANELIKPLYKFSADSSYHLYVLLINFEKIGISRNEFMKKLFEKGIGSQVHYIPINKQPYYKSLGYGNEETPTMDNYYSQCLSIPLYTSLSQENIKFISENILALIN
ncbi:MAG: UDP-4-amino-4,6-dideoxy-N-acetyl-beta-L-altrosamine transaminase [Candidatus Sericytochromatia bacterium]|nr:UDP-4-amino-4,6-dideoxy-N-acetyl-beta-L-altrosamine transaminase [Candidatus Sericytochromatia bacterium]